MYIELRFIFIIFLKLVNINMIIFIKEGKNMNIFQEGWINFKSMFTSRKYVSFKGCTTRREYWTTCFIIFLISLCLFVLDLSLSPNLLVTKYLLKETASTTSLDYFFNIIGIPFLSTLFAMITFLPILSMSVRRLHDTGHSGLFILIAFLLFFVAYMFIIPTSYYIESVEGGVVLVSSILSLIFLFASFVFSVIIIVYLASKSSYEDNKYREHFSQHNDKVENQSSNINNS